MTLTKAELAECLSEKFDLTKTDAKLLVENFFEEICLALENRDSVKLPGLGVFTIKDKKSRPGRNPKTGDEVVISPRTVVTFKQGQKMKEVLSVKK